MAWDDWRPFERTPPVSSLEVREEEDEEEEKEEEDGAEEKGKF